MYFDIFIAVAAVLLVINVFVVFLLKRLAIRAKNKIDANVITQLSVYDELIVDKSAELVRLTRELAEIEVPSYSDDSEIGTGSIQTTNNSNKRNPNYIDTGFCRKYDLLKNDFTFNKEEVIRKVISEHEQVNDSGIYGSIANKLNMDIVYKTLNLSAQEGEIFILGILFGTEKNVLAKYMESNDDFDILLFKLEVDRIAKKTEKIIYVRTGNKSDKFEHINPSIVTVYDESICEGIVVICGEIFYDFSLQKKEINS